MSTQKVRLTKEKETMLISLYARALHSRSHDPLLRDPWAEQAIERVEYDFKSIKLSGIEPLSIAIRARQFDAWVQEWIADAPASGMRTGQPRFPRESTGNGALVRYRLPGSNRTAPGALSGTTGL
jgi:hypothetical protein